LHAPAAQGLQGFAAAHGLQGLHAAAHGLHGLAAAQGLQGFAAQGLHGLHAAAHGLHGLAAAQGLQGLQGLAAAQGLQGLHDAAAAGVATAATVTAVPAAIPATTTKGIIVDDSNARLRDFCISALSQI